MPAALRVLLALAAALAPVAVRAVDARPVVRYGVELAKDARELYVKACVTTPREARRWDASPAATALLLETKRSSGAAVERVDGGLRTPGWRAGECLAYRVDLAALAAREALRRQPNGDLVAPPRDWLWRPRDLEPGALGEIAFELPAGWSVTVPWGPLDALPPRRRFRFDAGAPWWPTVVAFGRFPERDLVTDGGRARLALLGAISDTERDVLTDWLQQSGRDVAASFPRVFASSPQIVVVPSRGGRDAVPFGESYRGGAVALVLYVDVGRPLADYFASWTVHHELIHVLHPYLGDRGRWISEGLASYYQNVVRARAGHLTARQAWEKLDAGFERGRRDHVTTDLATTSAQSGRTRHYMRIYWSGAALALRADVALRTRARAPASLDAAFDAFTRCCLAANPVMKPRDFLAAMDAQAGGGPLAALFDAHVSKSAMPDLAATYRALGIARREDGTLVFDADPAHVALRRAIMGSDPRDRRL